MHCNSINVKLFGKSGLLKPPLFMSHGNHADQKDLNLYKPKALGNRDEYYMLNTM